MINLKFNKVNQRDCDEPLRSHHLLTADDERMSEIGHALEVVRGGKLH